MKLKFFWIPAVDSTAAEQELNQFLANHRIVEVEKTFSQSGTQAGWAFCVQWLSGTESAQTAGTAKRSKIDYREVLDEPTFRIFAALRSWRKKAAATRSVPIYTVATNEQLATVARGRIRTKSELEKIEGFGESRMANYGADLLEVCHKETAAIDGEGGAPP